MRRAALGVLVVALTMALPQSAIAAKVVNYPRSVLLIADESTRGFLHPTSSLTVPRGVVKLTTEVPDSASGSHGIGIDGGAYRDVRGVPVKPGHSTTLTVDLAPGNYKVFDSYKNNRAKGYVVTLHVTRARAKYVSYGRRCPTQPAFFVDFPIWVKNVSCRSARDLAEVVEGRWVENNYALTPIVEREFTCYVSTSSAMGLKFACLANGARVTWTS